MEALAPAVDAPCSPDVRALTPAAAPSRRQPSSGSGAAAGPLGAGAGCALAAGWSTGPVDPAGGRAQGTAHRLQGSARIWLRWAPPPAAEGRARATLALTAGTCRAPQACCASSRSGLCCAQQPAGRGGRRCWEALTTRCTWWTREPAGAVARCTARAAGTTSERRHGLRPGRGAFTCTGGSGLPGSSGVPAPQSGARHTILPFPAHA
jgi:hypothetical protein